MASNLLGNLVNYSDEDDDSDSETQQTPIKPPQNSEPTSKRKFDTDTNALQGSTPKKQVTSTIHIHSKPVVRPTSLPEPAPLKTTAKVADSDDALTPMNIEDGDEQEGRRKLLLKPYPVPGVENWNISPEPTSDCDPDVEARISHFLSLRESGTRFNEHLQESKAFRNPHIYEKLVEFVELDEYSSNFPKDQFDPHGLGADIDSLLEAQKKAAEEKALAQQNRSNIQFVPSAKPAPASVGQQPEKFADALARARGIASKLSHQAPRPS
ncbi:HCNGP-like protein-domain-containing protein [Umbelopsis sp. AD052]|nr:HCNGP-like protein-domain-containing protein [Umbelopsis sp. AD052]